MCRFSSNNSAFQGCIRFPYRSRHVSFVSSSNGLNAKARTIQYWVFKKIRAKSDRGMGIWRQRHRDVPRLRPGEDDQGLTANPAARRLGSGVPREEVRVVSGALKVLGAFWDRLEGSCRP